MKEMERMNDKQTTAFMFGILIFGTILMIVAMLTGNL